ncbi:MAG: DNA replication/repair protein RecF [Pseudomonadales bacterium]|nr:DNA replication/repair protein RecF [Pseudomonadales bacterium]
MSISQLRIENVGCIQKVDINPHPRFTLLSGSNGSGKSSFLEAIYLLGLARSFRTNNIKNLISDEEKECRVIAEYSDASSTNNKIGISKSRESDTLIRLNQTTLKTASELARILPIRIITQESFSPIDGPSKGRRQFIDWLAFHVEHEFNDTWASVQRLIKQRNALLKQGSRLNVAELSVWDEKLSQCSEKLNVLRQNVFEKLVGNFTPLVSRLLPELNIGLKLNRGWPEQVELAAILRANIERDLKLGYTRNSPNRADLQLKVGDKPASEYLSRGQKKLLICALSLAQIVTFSELKGEEKLPSIVLIDDIGAELDVANRQLLFETLDACNSQVFVTGTELQTSKTFLEKDSYKMFHVEQGRILPA